MAKNSTKSTSGVGFHGCSCLFWGVVLVFAGFLFLLEDLGQITLYGVRWWSVMIILLGLMKITKGLY